MVKTRTALVYAGLILLSCMQVHAQKKTLVNIDHILPKELRCAGFVLNNEQELEISATGFAPGRKSGMMFTQAWILNADTREVVWTGRDADEKSIEESLLFLEDKPLFQSGSYEVYYSSFPTYMKRHKRHNWWDRWKTRFFDSEKKEDLHNEYQQVWREFNINIQGSGRAFDKPELDVLRRNFNRTAVVSLTDVSDSDIIQQAFTVRKPIDVQIYSVGEALEEGTYDYGWISNVDTREIVWKFTLEDSRPAGGTYKNRQIAQSLYLPAGRYLASYSTDDSHSGGGWNSAPPFDPDFWGLTIKVQQESQKKNFELFDFDEYDDNVILRLTDLGDDDFQSAGFTCEQDVDLRIYAIGEGFDGEMYDYCWIVDSNNREKKWEMIFHESDHAGGSIKNRLFNQVVSFEKGSYMIYCVTDDNHSSQDWNDAPPHDSENWGLTILAADKNSSSDVIKPYSEKYGNNVLARVNRVGSDERIKERFEMRQAGYVNIYALGEGVNGDMYDYAWIESAETHQIVWEMNYQNSSHAGGTPKNREINTRLYLEKGEYLLYYKSDATHAFGDWNEAPPYDPASWGVTVTLAAENTGSL